MRQSRLGTSKWVCLFARTPLFGAGFRETKRKTQPFVGVPKKGDTHIWRATCQPQMSTHSTTELRLPTLALVA